ncbi:hypothetical protein BG005_007931 [Podila minutissima]|nr:hypothetical protein BG005_007931 [Podila minutissima]
MARTTAYRFLPLGPAGGAATWAFMYDTLGDYGVTLTGPDVGAWQTVPYKFNVTGAPGPESGSGGEMRNGGLSTGSLAGIIGGVVLVLGVAVFALCRHRKRASPKPIQEQKPYREPAHPYPMKHQKDDPYSELDPTPMVQAPFMPLDTKYYPPPESAASGQTSYRPSHTAHSPHLLSFEYPSLSPQSVINTLTDSETNSTISNSPYHNSSLPSTNPQYSQPNSAPPISQRAPQTYPTAGAPQEYRKPQGRPPRSQTRPPCSRVRRTPSQIHLPPQMYPAVAAPQYYGEPSRGYPLPPQVYPTTDYRSQGGNEYTR